MLKNDIKEGLKADLIALGLTSGMTVFVHSSLKGLATPNLSPQDVVSTLCELVGKDGTLLMPAFTYKNVTRQNPFYSCKATPSCVGIIPEIFRLLPLVQRSLNPVHSVCAIGKNTQELLCEHLLDDISIGVHSPIMKLPRFNGKILMLGCGLAPNTFMHGVENTAGAPYRSIKFDVNYTIEDMQGNRFKYQGGLPDMSMLAQRYDRVKNLLSPEDIAFGKVLNGEAWLIDSAALLKAGVAAIKQSPYFFVDHI